MPFKNLFFALFFVPVLLQAQNSGYFLDSGEGELRSTQRLTWIGDEYARTYEVIIEEEVEGTYRELRREFTTALFIEVSLLPGKYRCQVVPHTFLNQVGKASEWMYIEVLAALHPELDDILPEFFLLAMDTGSGVALYAMRVSGKNLIPGAEIFLHGPGGERIVPFEIQTGGNGTHVQLFFEKNQLVAGNYELIVINPGGFSTGRSGISFPPPGPVDKIDHIKPVRFAYDKVDIFLSTALMPYFTISDKGDRFFRQKLSFGTTGRFGVVSAKPNYFNPGLELAVSYGSFGTGSGGHALAFALNLSALKWFPGDRMALTFRLGAGYSVLLPDDGAAHTNMGGSFLLFVLKHLYLETGLDYAYWLSALHPSCFRPWIGMGWRF
jgi:hypothetical protein